MSGSARSPGANGRESGVRIAVPDDRVALLVEPVVRGCDIAAPRRRADVLDLGSGGRQGARARRVERPREPACDERPRHRASLGLKARAADNGQWDSHSDCPLYRVGPRPKRARVGRCPSRSSSAPAGASRSSARRCGSCARRAGRSPSTASSGSGIRFFEIAETPELCAEVTLQPVRRHDVDAAVLFADIVTPVIAMGAPVELVEGVGPVIDPPIRTADDDRAAPRALSGSCVRAGPRGDPTRACGAARGEGARRILRRAVHRRVLPRRGPREPRVPPRPRG